MNLKRSLLVLVTVLLVFTTTACSLRASTPPAPTPTQQGGGFPIPGTETMDIFEAIATQTALAEAGGGVPPAATAVLPGVTPQATAGEQLPAQPTQAAPTQPLAQPTQPVVVQPTNPPIVVPTATPGRPSTYTLQKGEFPYCIARRFDVNPVDLLSINGLGVNTVIQPGTSLRIPQSGSFPGGRELRDHPSSYTVRANDTIYSIACLYGDVDPISIAIANGLSEPYSLSSGTTIHIP
jgi:LysM repeat protein